MRRTVLAVGLLLASSLVALGLASCVSDTPANLPDAGTPEAGGGDSGGTDGAGDALTLDGGCGGEAGEVEAFGYQLPTFNPTDGLGVGVDSAGNAFFAGGYQGAGTIGDAAVPAPANVDGYVARRNADGSIGWVKTFGGAGPDVVTGLTVDANGDVYVTGVVSGTSVNVFGTNVSGGAAVQSAIVAKLRGSDGFPLWVRSFGPSAVGAGIKSAGGRLVVSFTYSGTVALAPASAGTTVTGQGGGVADVDPATGNANWAKSITTPSADAGVVTVQGLEHTATEVVVSGTFTSQNVNLGAGGNLVRVGSGSTGYYVGFDNNGGFTEKARFGVAAGGGVANTVIARDGKGTGFVVGGSVTGAIDFGTGPISAAGGGGNDAYLADLTNQGSAVAWQKVFGGAQPDGIEELDLDRCGLPVAVASVGSPLKVDGKDLFAGATSLSVLKLNPADGTVLMVHGSAPGSGEIYARCLAVGPANDLWLGGTMRGTVSFGALPALTVAGFGGFLVHYAR